MARCDQMKKGELYGCHHCGFEFQVTKEARIYEGQKQGACAMEMACCDDTLVLKGSGTGEPEGTSPGGSVTQPVMGSG